MTFFFKLRGLFLPLILVFMIMIGFATSFDISGFTYNGFTNSNLLDRDGVAGITSNGLFRLINFDNKQKMGYAFYSDPFKFKNPPSNDGNSSTADNKVFSFSTTFVFKIIPEGPDSRGQGIAFFIAPQRGPPPGAQPSQYLGLFNVTNTGNPANHVLAVELDTNTNLEYSDIDSNHVGVDVNGIVSNISNTAGYFTKSTGGGFKKLDLVNQKLQIWVDYDGGKKQLDVTLAPFMVPKPNTPLLSLHIDLSPIILDYMYVGLSSSLGNYRASSYIFGWSFNINGPAEELNLSQLPDFPIPTGPKVTRSILLIIIYILSGIIVIFICCANVAYRIYKRRQRISQPA